jgi:hypothetical protein
VVPGASGSGVSGSSSGVSLRRRPRKGCRDRREVLELSEFFVIEKAGEKGDELGQLFRAQTVELLRRRIEDRLCHIET